MKFFGYNVWWHRNKNGLRQKDLAERMNVHQRSYIGMIERGEKNVTLFNIYRLAEALECTMSDLLENEYGFGGVPFEKRIVDERLGRV